MNDSAISVRNVTKRFRLPMDKSATLKHRMVHLRASSRYRQLLALDDVSFEIAHGQFVGIIGRNGSGKSTLLKVLARIYRPTSGSLVIRGAVSPFLELGVGFNPELTARENVVLNGAILGLPRRELEARMDEMIHFAELEQFADTKLKNYSSGMQVRLAFTVSIQANAAILLMDEVLAVGDATFQGKCFDVFNQYKRDGRTIILVTHDLSAVDLYADRAIMLEHGKLLHDGNASEVTASYHRLIAERQDKDRLVSGGALIDLEDERPTDSRWGNGEVRVHRVLMLRNDGKPHVNFVTGELMTIRVELKARRAVSDLVIGVQLHRGDGMVIGGLNTHLSHAPVPPLAAGECLVADFVMPDLRLLQGTYRATVGLHSTSHSETYDWLEKAFEFRVTDEQGRPGSYDIGALWEVRKVGDLTHADVVVTGARDPD